MDFLISEHEIYYRLENSDCEPILDSFNGMSIRQIQESYQYLSMWLTESLLLSPRTLIGFCVANIIYESFHEIFSRRIFKYTNLKTWDFARFSFGLVLLILYRLIIHLWLLKKYYNFLNLTAVLPSAQVKIPFLKLKPL